MSAIADELEKTFGTIPQAAGLKDERTGLLDHYRAAARDAADFYWTMTWSSVGKVDPHTLMGIATEAIDRVIEVALDTNKAVGLEDRDFEFATKVAVVAAFGGRLSEVAQCAGGAA